MAEFSAAGKGGQGRMAMRGRMLKVVMVILVLIPVGLTAYLARNLYQRKGVPEALENLTRQLFQSKADERKAEARAKELEHKTAELQNAYDALVSGLQGETSSREVRVRRFKESLEINFVDKVLFASASAEITPHGREVLTKVAGVLAKLKDKSIYVVGHTDSMPIHLPMFPSNWELSTARASAVIRFLSGTGGVAPERFTAMGRSFYQPVASNATPQGRKENRRVDVIVAEVPLFEKMAHREALEGTDGTSADHAPASAPADAGPTQPRVRGAVSPDELGATTPPTPPASATPPRETTPAPVPATPAPTSDTPPPADQAPAIPTPDEEVEVIPAPAPPSPPTQASAPETATTPAQPATETAPQPALPPTLPTPPAANAPSGS